MNPARNKLTPHERRQRAIRQRQTTVIGGLVAVLLLIALVAAAIWAQILPSPFDREFSADPESGSDGTGTSESAQVCPPPGSTPRPLDEITANVFNATDRGGLAGTTAQQLTATGIVVNQQGNWAGSPLTGAVRIIAGAPGVVPAYSVARLFPSAEVTMDDRTDESIDIVLGEAYDAMLPPEEVSALDQSQPLAAPEDCQPIEEAPTAEG
ncbi:LytR C-terminal domain-containing protein [Georgenia sp. Z1344]|uniref:LytR C-terminal domain-containing protein n=1 Tax=Georgenia sp. Z1344 TaxID=3416706 RepID=UPI003CF5D8A2